MPLVKVEIRKGRDAHYKKKLFDCIHQSLVEILKIPQNDRNLRLIEYDIENFEIPANRTEMFTLIEISMFEGRTLDTKKKLYKDINIRLKAELNIEGTDIFIILNEIPLDNWGIRGGKAASEIDFGFKINI